LIEASVDKSFQPEHGMANRFATAQSTVEMQRWVPPGIVTLAAMVALMALTADAAARQARPAPLIEATAPRDAGEPIMAIVSINSQQVRVAAKVSQSAVSYQASRGQVRHP
jgi:hypothetical protein